MIFVFLLTLSCSKEDDNDVNQAPSIFLVKVDEISGRSASISWDESIDPEGSTVFYDIYLNATKLADNITELSYTFENLSENVSYSGEIIASDPDGNTITAAFTFEIAENQPPSSFNITASNTNPFYSKIEWPESIDPEGGEVIYNIYLGNELIAEQLTTSNYIFSELKGLQNYMGYVEAIDVEGKLTKVEYSFTTEIKIYEDDLTLDNQALVESFGESGYNQINGNLTIGSLQSNLTDVVDLSSLETINTVNGNLSIKNTDCKNFNGLDNIKVNDQFAKLTIENNDQLLNCNGLSSISTIHEVYISDNESLSSLEGLSSLHSVTNYLWIVFNPNLNSLNGLQNLNNVSRTLDISNNDSLSALLGLENISTINELNIIDNDNLESLNGLSNLTSCSSSLVIADNNVLQSLGGISNLNYSGSARITDNPLLVSLTGLENLTNVNHTLEIARNSGLLTLKGIENVVFSDNQANYHELTIWENPQITDLDALTNFTFNRGKITIYFNSKLTNFCGITKIVSEIDDFMNDYNFSSNNAFNPSEADILSGNCFL